MDRLESMVEQLVELESVDIYRDIEHFLLNAQVGADMDVYHAIACAIVRHPVFIEYGKVVAMLQIPESEFCMNSIRQWEHERFGLWALCAESQGDNIAWVRNCDENCDIVIEAAAACRQDIRDAAGIV